MIVVLTIAIVLSLVFSAADPTLMITVGVGLSGFLGLVVVGRKHGAITTEPDYGVRVLQQRELAALMVGGGDAAPEGIQIHWRTATAELSDGDTIDLHRLEISGAVTVPHEDFEGLTLTIMRDVTGLPEHEISEAGAGFPVLCHIDTYTDDDGWVIFERPLTIPYVNSRFEELPIAVIPMGALVLAHRGTRRMRITVIIGDATTRSVILREETFVEIEQVNHGYLERTEKRQDTLCAMIRLAMCVCAADGHVDDEETAIIRRFLAGNLLGSGDEESLSAVVSETLEETIRTFTANTDEAQERLEGYCKAMADLGSNDANQAAYELCAEIAAIDGEVVGAELETLKAIAAGLHLDESVVRSAHDRTFKTEMFEEQSASAILGMPAGLSQAEQVKFLNREYKKWRARVTHKDPKVAADAELRIQLITKMRGRLTRG